MAVKVYSTPTCPYCDMAKAFLKARHIAYDEISIENDDAKRDEMIRLSNRRTVPQIFIHQQSIGGYDDLAALAASGKLHDLLNPS